MSRLKNNNNNYKIIARKSYNIFVYRKYFRGIDLFCSRAAIYIHTFYFKKDNA